MSEDEVPDNEWDSEVYQRALAGEDEETVRTEVINRSLDVCDPRPLVSAILKGRHISATTRRHLAAIFDKAPRVNEPVPTVLGVRFSHKRLRKHLTLDQIKWVKLMQASQQALYEGNEPHPRFWKDLVYGLCRGHPQHQIGHPPEYPIEFRLQFRAQNHRPSNPFLPIRNRVVRWHVEEIRKTGLTMAAAIEKVAKECNWSERTVKRAVYDD